MNPALKDVRSVMAMAAFFLVSAFPLLSNAGPHDPFPPGYSMGNDGTILHSGGPSGRQPWAPAGFYGDTLNYGFSACGIDYYDAMDNYESSHISQALAGGWYRYKSLVCKASYAYLQALGAYNEQEGFFSAATTAIPFANTSLELTGFRSGLMDGSKAHESFVHAGMSVLVSLRYAALSLSCGDLPLKAAADAGFDPPPTLTAAVHTRFNGMGAQGVACELWKEGDYQFRFSVGEEYNFNNYFSVCTALSTNPFMLHFGVTVLWSNTSASLAFVQHPVLGWSKGLTFDWAH